MTIGEFNYIESGIWFVISIGLTIDAYRRGKNDDHFNITVIASFAFVAFGISELIEAQTGAWWRPLSLLVFKGACVFTFVVCFYKYRKITATNK